LFILYVQLYREHFNIFVYKYTVNISTVESDDSMDEAFEWRRSSEHNSVSGESTRTELSSKSVNFILVRSERCSKPSTFSKYFAVLTKAKLKRWWKILLEFLDRPLATCIDFNGLVNILHG
jgi:hypothetical protein